MRSAVAEKYGSSFGLDRAMHDAFVRLFDPNGLVPSRGVQEIREGRQAPWRILARRLMEARQAHVPREHVKGIVAALDRWIDELYGLGRCGYAV